MDTVTLSKQNRLFWLGRYTERVYSTVQVMLRKYDELIDSDAVDYAGFCGRMGIPCPYESAEDFWKRYLFDAADPVSIYSSMDAALGNGTVLRETISTPTLAYLQMAISAMDLASRSDSPGVELQWVLDDIMGFRGSFDDSVEEEAPRNIIKSGICGERISLMLRLDWHKEHLEREMQKMLNRLYKTDLPVDKAALDLIDRCAMGGEDVPRGSLLRSVEGLFLV